VVVIFVPPLSHLFLSSAVSFASVIKFIFPTYFYLLWIILIFFSFFLNGP
jgi:hypothetical protein